MSNSLFKTLQYSVPYYPEWTIDANYTTYLNPGHPGEINFETDAGIITGIHSFEGYFYVFLQRAQYIFGYTGKDADVAPGPLDELRRFNYGANFDRFLTNIEMDGFEYIVYLADNGDIRMTNGPTYDKCLSDNIRPITQTLLNNRTIDNYYNSAHASQVPVVWFNKRNKILRVGYAGESTLSNKLLSYSFENKAWLTAEANICQAINVIGISSDYTAVVGNSDNSGITYGILNSTISSDKAMTLDLGWIRPSKPSARVKLYNIEMRAHAHVGCNTVLTFTIYNNPTEYASVRTETRPLVYNNDVNNLQKIFVNSITSGNMVRVVITDNGTNANYSIDRVVLHAEELDSSN
jgi:hypothetical protein